MGWARAQGSNVCSEAGTWPKERQADTQEHEREFLDFVFRLQDRNSAGSCYIPQCSTQQRWYYGYYHLELVTQQVTERYFMQERGRLTSPSFHSTSVSHRPLIHLPARSAIQPCNNLQGSVVVCTGAGGDSHVDKSFEHGRQNRPHFSTSAEKIRQDFTRQSRKVGKASDR